MAKLRQQTERIGYPILGVVSQLNALCRDKLGEYCHWGATTQDITDTATVLQIREGARARRARPGGHLGGAWPRSRRTHRDTPMIGRSNLQQAIPVTFGYKMAGLLSAIERHRERLAQLQAARAGRRVRRRVPARWRRCEKGAMETQAGLCAELGLEQPVIAWHTIRDNIAEVGTLPRPGRRHARQAQHGRQADDADRGRRGLRALRARPRLEQHDAAEAQSDLVSCYIHAAISVVRQHAAALMDAMVADHERSTGPWEIEWIVLPEAFCLMAGALKQSRFVLEGLEVDAAGDARATST